MSSYYCRLCMTNSIPEECTIFSKTITEMLHYCIPEINVKLVNNPILCGNCKKSLEQSTEFKKKCLEVQNQIEKFKETNRESLDLSLVSAACGTITPQSPGNISFDGSYRKFLASSTTEITADSNDDEVSKIMNRAKEEIKKCDDFLDLLESSTNIKKPRMDNIEKSPEKEDSFNFYDDTLNSTSSIDTPSKRSLNTRSKSSLDITLDKSSLDTSKSTLKNTSQTEPSEDTSDSNLSKVSSRSKTPRIIKTVVLKPRTSVKAEPKKALPHSISHPLDVRIDKTICLSCDKNFLNVTKLMYHLYFVHQKTNELYTCLFCRYKVKQWRTLRKHLNEFHTNCYNIYGSCPFCFTHTQDVNTLKQHLRAHHRNICSSDRFRCNSCTFRTTSMESLKRHLLQNHELTCNYCIKDFENADFLNRHIRCHLIQQKKQVSVLQDPLELVEVKVEEDNNPEEFLKSE